MGFKDCAFVPSFQTDIYPPWQHTRTYHFALFFFHIHISFHTPTNNLFYLTFPQQWHFMLVDSAMVPALELLSSSSLSDYLSFAVCDSCTAVAEKEKCKLWARQSNPLALYT
jgi:hypothetical protein